MGRTLEDVDNGIGHALATDNMTALRMLMREKELLLSTVCTANVHE
jgi:hypothetical protein